MLVNITGGSNFSLDDKAIIMETISANIDPEANIIMGACIDENLGDNIRVVVIATGFSRELSNITQTSEVDSNLSEVSAKEEGEKSKKVKVLPEIGKIVSREEFFSKGKLQKQAPKENGDSDVSIPAILRKNKIYTFNVYEDDDITDMGHNKL